MSSCLDNVFINQTLDQCDHSIIESGLSDHKAVIISFPDISVQPAEIRKRVAPITTTGLNTLKLRLASIDWISDRKSVV